jgi:hypothetical protein
MLGLYFNVSSLGQVGEVFNSGRLKISYSIIYGNSDYNFKIIPTGCSGCVGQVSDKLTGVSESNPKLGTDWKPLAGSPVINAGNPSILDKDGSRSDIGLFGGPNSL